jgi:chromosome segregation ATPase
MSHSQVVSFRASGHFLNWIEAQRLEGESVSQAAQRILKELSGVGGSHSVYTTTDLDVSTMSTKLSTSSEDVSTSNALNVMSTNIVDSVDESVSERLDPVMGGRAMIEELPGKLDLREGEIGSLKQELEDAKASYKGLLESSTHVTNKLRLEAQELRSQVEQERADREQVEMELADLKQKSALASKKLPEAADLLNQLKAKRKKSTVSLTDIETLLEIIEKSYDDTPKGL